VRGGDEISVLQKLPGDHQSLDFAGTLADGAQFHIAIVLFSWIVFDESIAAMNLNALIGTLDRYLAGKELGHGGLEGRLQSRIFHTGGTHRKEARSVNFSCHVSKLP